MPSHLAKPPTPILRPGRPATQGLVALFPCQGPDGQTLRDQSGRGNHGTLNGPSWTTGAYGPALAYDGVNDHTAIPASGSLDFNGKSFTFFCRLQLTGLGDSGYRTLLNRGGFGSQRIYLLVDPSGVLYRWGDFNSGYALANGRWYDLVYTLEATSDTQGTETFYVDGVKVAARTGSSPGTGAGSFYLGDTSGGGHRFQGRMDLVGFHDRALSVGEVAARQPDPFAPLRAIDRSRYFSTLVPPPALPPPTVVSQPNTKRWFPGLSRHRVRIR